MHGSHFLSRILSGQKTFFFLTLEKKGKKESEMKDDTFFPSAFVITASSIIGLTEGEETVIAG